MSDIASLGTVRTAERERVWQMYKAGGLSIEALTAQLLRLDIDERAATRNVQDGRRLRLD